MKSSIKALLASLAIALMAAGVVLIYVYVYLPFLIREKGKEGYSQGLAVGQQLDQMACFRKATALAGNKTLEAMTAGPWLSGCLESSRLSTGFCDGIPPPSEHPDFERQKAACQAREIGEYCLFFMPTVEEHCHSQ
jgi:hypothetical protein